VRPLATVLCIAIGVAAVAAASVAVWYERDLARARNEVERGAGVVDTAAGPIEYAERGRGYPLLSIHGAGGGYDQGLANAADLVGDGFRVIAPSRFGYLGTPIPADRSPAAQADAHAALLDALSVDKAIVVGVSAGTRSAIELAIRHPDKVAALILIVPATYAPEDAPTIAEGRGNAFAFWLANAGADFAWWATERIAPSVLVRFIGVPPDLVEKSPPAERARVMAIVRSILPLSRRFPGINIDSIPDPAPPALERIVAPTLAISARDDLFRTAPAAEYAASRIPNAMLKIYDTGGHLLVNRGAETKALIQEFLAANVPPVPDNVAAQ
jgi:2-hydroxy-6-oxonona-2,4-dienedioate hydrolase